MVGLDLDMASWNSSQMELEKRNRRAREYSRTVAEKRRVDAWRNLTNATLFVIAIYASLGVLL